MADATPPPTISAPAKQVAAPSGTGSAAAQWSLLAALSMAIGAALEALGIPAALLIGPMLAGIAARLGGASIHVGRWPYRFAQAVVGLLIADTFEPSILGTVGAHWALFLGIVVATYATSLALGWAMSRLKILPGSTAVWGSSPGAASAMMLMAEAFGADPRLVAFMQYLRVLMVALMASIVAKLWIADHAGRHGGDHGGSDNALSAAFWLAPVHALPFAGTLALALGGAIVGGVLRIPAGPLLLPMVTGAVLRASGLFAFDLPPWLLAIAYGIVGWHIGLGFTREVMRRAARVAPAMAASVVTLIVVCGGFAWLLVRLVGVDPLTAYLATSPGGMDTVAIIGASAHTDLPFVMALHAMRFAIVLTAGPTIARMVARWTNTT